MSLKRICAIAWLGIAMAVSHAETLDGLSLYKGLDGNFSTASSQDLEILRQAAKAEGQITIWVAFNMEFAAIPELRTPEIERQEAAIKQRIMDRVVTPLVNKGQVEILPLSERQTSAPGCMLAVTAAGLTALAHSTDVKYIGHVPR